MEVYEVVDGFLGFYEKQWHTMALNLTVISKDLLADTSASIWNSAPIWPEFLHQHVKISRDNKASD